MTATRALRLLLFALPLGLDTFALSTALGVTPMPARTLRPLADPRGPVRPRHANEALPWDLHAHARRHPQRHPAPPHPLATCSSLNLGQASLLQSSLRRREEPRRLVGVAQLSGRAARSRISPLAGTFREVSSSWCVRPESSRQAIPKKESTMPRFPKQFLPATLAIGVLVSQALPALACGSLVAPNGALPLSRATTFVSWHDGVERYLTAFTYQGDVANLGWIVPLPAIPTKIEEGGAWTLQRLQRETHPLPPDVRAAGAANQATPSAQVIEQVQVEALNITVLKGSGQEVLVWCQQNGFTLSAETRAHLLGYARGSPIFMAAKYDTARAQARGQLQGDGAPVLITMPTKYLWVPLEALALEGQQGQADLYLLTDQPVNTIGLGAAICQAPIRTQRPRAPGFP